MSVITVISCQNRWREAEEINATCAVTFELQTGLRMSENWSCSSVCKWINGLCSARAPLSCKYELNTIPVLHACWPVTEQYSNDGGFHCVYSSVSYFISSKLGQTCSLLFFLFFFMCVCVCYRAPQLVGACFCLLLCLVTLDVVSPSWVFDNLHGYMCAKLKKSLFNSYTECLLESKWKNWIKVAVSAVIKAVGLLLCSH